MGLSSIQAKRFYDVFEKYPWDSLPLALEKGAFELIDANEMEAGEVYIIARKDNFGSGERDLKITTEVLTYQLFSILSQDDTKNSIEKIINERLWMFKKGDDFYDNENDEFKKIMEKYGLDYRPSIELSDTFIMGCYYSKLNKKELFQGAVIEEQHNVKTAYNNVKRFLGVVFSNRDFSVINQGATSVDELIEDFLNPQKGKRETESERLRNIVRNDSYNTSSREITQWAYVFKIQLQNLKDAFMNWDTMPF